MKYFILGVILVSQANFAKAKLYEDRVVTTKMYTTVVTKYAYFKLRWCNTSIYGSATIVYDSYQKKLFNYDEYKNNPQTNNYCLVKKTYKLIYSNRSSINSLQTGRYVLGRAFAYDIRDYYYNENRVIFAPWCSSIHLTSNSYDLVAYVPSPFSTIKLEVYDSNGKMVRSCDIERIYIKQLLQN